MSVLGGAAAVASPLPARAQQRNGVRRVGVLMNLTADDPKARTFLAEFVQRLQEAGWANGQNVEIHTRWAAGDLGQYQRYAAQLVAIEPDVILAATTPAVRALQKASPTVPIVFVAVIDPVGSNLIASMSRPGGSSTGFVIFEYSLAAKWLQLLKEVAPSVTRAAVLRDASQAAGIGQFAAIQTVASIDLELSAIDLRDVDEIERAVAVFAQGSNGGLILTASQFGANNPNLIAMLAARHKLPAIYPFRYFVRTGGLISYGSDQLNEYRSAAGYVDRILKGAKPADLPVQAPTKMSSRSTSRPLRRSGSRFRSRFSLEPTR